MNKSSSMASFRGLQNSRRDLGSDVSINRRNGSLHRHLVNNRPMSNATWDEPSEGENQQQKSMNINATSMLSLNSGKSGGSTKGLTQGRTKRDAFAYYSCPNVRRAALLQPGRRTNDDIKKDFSQLFGLQRPPARNYRANKRRGSLASIDPSVTSATEDETSVSTRNSRLSFELHPSIFFQQMTLEEDQGSKDGPVQADKNMDSGKGRAPKETARSDDIIGREIIAPTQSQAKGNGDVVDDVSDEDLY